MADDMNNRIKSILTDLAAVRENLLAFSDDIWLGIDHNDPVALDRGYQFKKAYNDKVGALVALATDVSDMVQSFAGFRVESNGTEPDWTTDADNRRIIRELDKEIPHTLDESFVYKRPYGYVLQDRAFTGLVTWKNLYVTLCRQLASADEQRFLGLPDNPGFTTCCGNKLFSRDRSHLRVGLLIRHGIHAETHFSANSIRDCIKRLLDEFNMSHNDMRIYLREDRDAESK